MLVRFDFETRSRADLKKVGAYKYAEDPSTEILCYAYQIDSGPTQGVLGCECAPDLRAAILAGAHLHAWNVAFEWALWTRVCTPRHGWPVLEPGQLRDSMALAAVHNLPQALGPCALALGLPGSLQKDKRGEHLITLLSKPIAAGGKKGQFREDPALLDEMLAYCVQDVVTETAVAARLAPLSDAEQAAWLGTHRINERGLPVALEEIGNVLTVVESETRHLNAELARLTGISAATKRDQVLAWVRASGLGLPDLTAETLARTLARDDLTDLQRRVLQIRDAVSQTSTAKYGKMLSLACEDGRIHGLLTYHGASTGRDASRGLNAQNLARPPLEEIRAATEGVTSLDWRACRLIWGDDVMAAAVTALRGVIKAPPGYEFLDADFSSVENRVASWIAGQDDKVEMFSRGLDEYKVFATSLYGVPYGAVTKHQRQVSKSAVLGCMFGQGWRGLIEYATTYGVTLTDKQSKDLVTRYRLDYAEVQSCWYDCDAAMAEALGTPGMSFPAGSRLRFKVEDDFLKLRLPSGRVLHWYEPRVVESVTPWGTTQAAVETWRVNATTHKWERAVLIGSSAFQSAVQGTARDLLIHGVHNLEAAGYPVVLRVHDEVLALVPQGFGSEAEFGRLLCTAPHWAEELPLAFEAWRGDRFRK